MCEQANHLVCDRLDLFLENEILCAHLVSWLLVRVKLGDVGYEKVWTNEVQENCSVSGFAQSLWEG